MYIHQQVRKADMMSNRENGEWVDSKDIKENITKIFIILTFEQALLWCRRPGIVSSRSTSPTSRAARPWRSSGPSSASASRSGRVPSRSRSRLKCGRLKNVTGSFSFSKNKFLHKFLTLPWNYMFSCNHELFSGENCNIFVLN